MALLFQGVDRLIHGIQHFATEALVRPVGTQIAPIFFFLPAARVQVATLATTALGSEAKPAKPTTTGHHGAENGTFSVLTKDRTRLFYRGWGQCKPIVFSHGWPLTSDAWDSQLAFFGDRGLRVIAYDHRSNEGNGLALKFVRPACRSPPCYPHARAARTSGSYRSPSSAARRRPLRAGT